jgi:S1-C subfamily serine protease
MEEKKRNSYTVIAIAALAAILLGCVAGALAGGVAGFLVGRHEGQLAANRALDGAMSDLRQLRREMLEGGQEEQPVPKPQAEERSQPPVGALLLEIIPGSPADEVGLQAGDIIVGIDGTPINPNHPGPDILAQYKPGDRVTVRFWRADQMDSVRVTLGKHPEALGQPYLGVFFRPTARPQFERPQD